MSEVVGSVLELVGNTPLVRLNRLPKDGSATVLAKMESLNPAGSVKDRIALSMVRAAEAEGRLKPGDTIVEPTSGNTGIALAMVAAVKGYRLILTMPEGMSLERSRLLGRYGVEVVLTPANEGMPGAVRAAEELVKGNSRYFMPHQFENLANPEAHRDTTAREIVDATGGNVSAFVAGVGTGGTLTGVGEVLKNEVPGVKVYAVEPARSPVLSGGKPGVHGVQGIGPGFVPAVLRMDIVDSVVTVSDEDAYHISLRLAREEGILAGIASGANVYGALMVAEGLGTGKVVVTLITDTGERYLSVPFCH
ncbi:MAG: cysteine synthase A [Chloroflexi bacterium]|nr:cysteine synthase A [Chloroflexota bacterium]